MASANAASLQLRRANTGVHNLSMMHCLIMGLQSHSASETRSGRGVGVWP